MRRVVRGFVFALVAAQIAAPTIASHGTRTVADTGSGGSGPFSHTAHMIADTGSGGSGPFAQIAHLVADTGSGGSGPFAQSLRGHIA